MENKNSQIGTIIFAIIVAGVIAYSLGASSKTEQINDLQSQVQDLQSTNDTLQTCVNDLKDQKDKVITELNSDYNTYNELWDKINFSDSTLREDPCN